MVALDAGEEFFTAGLATPAVVGEDAAILGADAAVTGGTEGAVATEEGAGAAEELGPGVDRGDGRDIFGKFTGKGGYGSDAEARTLNQVEEDTGQVVIRKQVQVKLPKDAEVSGIKSSRKYDGLVQKQDGTGTYEGIEVKSGSSSDAAQERFDQAVNDGTPATGVLNGKPITITSVRTLRVDP